MLSKPPKNSGWEAKVSTLRLLQRHLPPDAQFFDSLYQYENFLGNGQQFSSIMEYCSMCGRIFGVGEAECCGVLRYEGNEEEQENRVVKNYFVMCNLEPELRTRFADAAFCHHIGYPLNRVKHQEDAIEDIYDGTGYPENPVYGRLHCVGSADGIKVFKTTSEQLWLVMLVLAELPPEMRYKQDNMVMLGAWWGKKPKFDVLMTPIAEQLNALSAENGGFQVVTALGEYVHVTLQMLTATADNPAKEAMINYQATACGTCQQQRVLVENVNGVLNVPTFPFLDPPAPLRTNASIIDDGEMAHQANMDALLQNHNPDHVVNGIKGLSAFVQVTDFDLVLGYDYQHDTCLGHVAKQLRLWFAPKHADQPFSHRELHQHLDETLKSAKAPSFITRAFLNQETVMGTSYKRSKKRMNNIVVVREGQQEPRFLQVHSFHWVEQGQQRSLIALGRQLELVGELFAAGDDVVIPEYLDHLNHAMFPVIPIVPNLEMNVAIDARHIRSLCVYHEHGVQPRAYVAIRHSSHYFLD